MTSDVQVRTADDVVTSSLPVTSGGLAALYAGYVVVHAGAVHEPGRTMLIAMEACTAAVFAVVTALAVTRNLPGWRRQSVAACLVLFAVGVTVARTAVIGRPWPTAELLLLVLIAAATVTSKRWFLVSTLACLIGWAAALAASWPAGGLAAQEVVAWLHLGLTMGVATAVAIAVRSCRLAGIDALVQARARVDEQGVRDHLTGVANRRGLDMVAAPMLENARRQGQAVHCLVVDVDGFRAVNDALGHQQGDRVLQSVAESLRAATRTTDVVARWGNDEFVVIGPGTGTSPLEMERRVRAHVTQTPPVAPEQWSGRVSAGSATLVPWDEGDLDSLLRRAEQDLSLRRSLRARAYTRPSPTPEPPSEPSDPPSEPSAPTLPLGENMTEAGEA